MVIGHRHHTLQVRKIGQIPIIHKERLTDAQIQLAVCNTEKQRGLKKFQRVFNFYVTR